jgi:NhaP-type Na+/H+ and K+/H+ antiporter
LIPLFIQQMLLGALLGYVFGRLAAALVNRMNLDYQGLYPVLTIALVHLDLRSNYLAWAGMASWLFIWPV